MNRPACLKAALCESVLGPATPCCNLSECHICQAVLVNACPPDPHRWSGLQAGDQWAPWLRQERAGSQVRAGQACHSLTEHAIRACADAIQAHLYTESMLIVRLRRAWSLCAACLLPAHLVVSRCARGSQPRGQSHCCRLGAFYGLQVVSAKTILAAVDSAPSQLAQASLPLCLAASGHAWDLHLLDWAQHVAPFYANPGWVVCSV